MKELFLSNPLLLVPLIATCLLYLFLAFQSARQKKIASKLEKICIVALLFTLPGVTFPPFNTLHPGSLVALHKSFISAVVQIGFYITVLLILRIRIQSIIQAILLLFHQGFLSLLLVFLLLSFAWSSNPLMTLRYSIVLIGLSSCAAYVARKYSWSEFGDLVLWSTAITAVSSMFLAILVPSIGVLHEEGKTGWIGVLSHPLHLGSVMALGASLWFLQSVEFPRKRLVSIFLFVFQFVVMQFANSAGAFVSCLFIIGVCLIPSYLRRFSFEQIIILCSSTALVCFGVIAGIILNFQFIINSLGRDMTLTGRLPLWNAIFSLPEQHLWFGYGYAGFWQPWWASDSAMGKLNMSSPAYPVQKIVGIWAVHAHNGFLDIYLSLGLIGLILFLLSFSNNLARAVRYSIRQSQPARFIPLALMVFIFTSNLTESQLLEIRYIWFYYVFLTVKLGIDAAHIPTSQSSTAHFKQSDNHFSGQNL